MEFSAKRQRTSKWSQPNQRTIIPDVAHILPPDLTPDILHTFLLRFQLEEVEYKLSSIDEELENMKFYDSSFKLSAQKNRISEEVRAKDILLQERQQIIASIEKMYPIFNGYMSNKQFTRQIDLPSASAISQIMGTKGGTIKEFEKDYNVKISFRGAGVSYEYESEGTDNSAFILIMGDNEKSVEKCHKRLLGILERSHEYEHTAPTEGDQNDLRLSFDPFTDAPPWVDQIPESSASHDTDGMDFAMKELMHDIYYGRTDETESSSIEKLLDRFKIDVALCDISSVLREPAPLGF